eukprot:TRINITY_DN229_c0_g1_i4.p2 TRINITY_DN229_c0_g1~~TRINITY_DN229_c0_g1_i4.p2  ORF type:complete len:120 (-),score=44.02 TRINITY_DN229_c0_g1_i4:130-489(-)
MAPKKDKKADAGKNPGKAGAAKKGGAQKKKKWSKGKVREKLNNLVVFDQQTYDRMLVEVKNFKLVTPSAISERLKINGSLARRAITKLLEAGLIKPVERHSRQMIYTRNIADDEEAATE